MLKTQNYMAPGEVIMGLLNLGWLSQLLLCQKTVASTGKLPFLLLFFMALSESGVYQYWLTFKNWAGSLDRPYGSKYLFPVCLSFSRCLDFAFLASQHH